MAYQADPRLDGRIGDKVGWLTTVTPKGRPAPKPVWFVLDGDDVIVFSEPDTAKLRHIEANDEVSFHFNSNAGGGDILVINGRARIEDGKASDAPGYLGKYEELYPRIGLDTAGFDEKFSVKIRIAPERSWGF